MSDIDSCISECILFPNRRHMLSNTLTEEVLETIKDKILSGVLLPGDRLRYETLAAELNVSLTTIKKAFICLENEGLIQIIPRRGAYVTSLTKRDIHEYTQIRFALESLAVDMACGNQIPGDHLRSLESINKELRGALLERNLHECMMKDIEFHHAIVKLGENKRLVELMNQLPLSNFNVLAGAQDIMMEQSEAILAVHNAIIESLAARNAGLTKSLLKVNIFFPQMEIKDHSSESDTEK